MNVKHLAEGISEKFYDVHSEYTKACSAILKMCQTD